MRFLAAGTLAVASAGLVTPVEETLFTDFQADNIDGYLVDFEEAYEGRVSIVVNVASEWGYAKYHYPQLQNMYEEYESRGLSVVAFPCNQFGGQEPGTNEEIKAHVEEKYGITFDMMSKIDVNGENENPLYTWLKGSEAGGSKRIQWNFTNFLINRCGKVVARHEPPEHPITWEGEVLRLLDEDISECQDL